MSYFSKFYFHTWLSFPNAILLSPQFPQFIRAIQVICIILTRMSTFMLVYFVQSHWNVLQLGRELGCVDFRFCISINVVANKYFFNSGEALAKLLSNSDSFSFLLVFVNQTFKMVNRVRRLCTRCVIKLNQASKVSSILGLRLKRAPTCIVFKNFHFYKT